MLYFDTEQIKSTPVDSKTMLAYLGLTSKENFF